MITNAAGGRANGVEVNLGDESMGHIVTRVETSLQPMLTIERNQDGRPRIQVFGKPGHKYALQATTNLLETVQWRDVTNFDGSSATMEYSEPAAAQYKQQFYRAKLAE